MSYLLTQEGPSKGRPGLGKVLDEQKAQGAQVSMVETIRIDCPCGHPNCPGYGSPRAKAWRNGETHIKRCPCSRCAGGRFKAKARIREHKVAKDIGGTRAFASGILTGFDVASSVVEIEETSQESIVRGLRRWWNSQGVQKKLSRLMAHHTRARAFLLHWDKEPQLVVMPYTDFVELAQMAQLDRRGISPEKVRQVLEQLIEEAS